MIRDSRPVNQYDQEGNLINTFDSVKVACDEMYMTSSNLYKCLTGATKTAGGYVWKYEEVINHVKKHKEH